MSGEPQPESCGLTNKAKCIRPEDEGGKVSQAADSGANCHGYVSRSVLVRQVLATKVLADIGAEEEQQVSEERCLNGTPAELRNILT